jgi:conjugative relaxase-like TrwC/TraI family protein
MATVTISSGHDPDYLLTAVATGRENYYTGAVAAGEPPGRWSGRGAEALGLTGLVEAGDMKAVYEHFLDPRDPNFRNPEGWKDAATLGHTGRKYTSAEEIYQRSLDAEPHADAERRERLRLDASKKARKNVTFLDATFSVQKSITVLHAAFEAQEVEARRRGDTDAAGAWAAHKQAVEDAIWAGNNAALDYLTDKAGYCRVGHHGGSAGRYSDAHDWTIASFFQHDSRNHDPQLHIHNAILNRVQGADGIWRTLDSRAIHKFRAAAAAVGTRVTEEHLAGTLGLRFATRPDGKSREILGIPQAVLDLFSSRRRAITAKTAILVAAFETRFDRSPNALELDRLQRQATFATRRPKSHDGESVEQRLTRWDRELRAEVAGGLVGVARDVLHLAGESVPPQPWSVRDVVAAALADVQAKKAAWTAADLTRAVSDALPDQIGLTDTAGIAALLDDLTTAGLRLAVLLDADLPGDHALPDELRVANGRSVYEAPGGRLYATPEQVHTERLLAVATTHRDAAAVSSAHAGRFLDKVSDVGLELGADQAAAVRGVLTSGVSVESLVGPAGTGKSFVVGVIAQAWQDPTLWDGQQRRVFGLAASQIATDVLAGEGLTARNITQWLNTQRRLAAGTAQNADSEWRLNAGDLVVVDESAMADTAALAAIHAYVQQAGAKLLLTGDHRQLAAVGAAGGMELITRAGVSYELSEVRRFGEEWERAASLQLRDGDETVLADYHKHGRLLDAGAVEQAEASAARAWLADTLAGQHALLIVDTNEQAARLSAQIRAQLVRLGKVDEHGVPLGLQGSIAGVGDLVQARKNEWRLAHVDGNQAAPTNRRQYRVLHTREDGGLIVAPILDRTAEGERLGEKMTLPGSYVHEHVALGYAATVHSAQGLTVDTGHTVVTSHTGLAALYVGMSRGRDKNTAHVCTRAVPDDAPTGAVNQALHRPPVTVLATAFETADPAKSALATATESQDEARAIKTPAELFADGCQLATAGRTARWLDQLTDTGHLTPAQRATLASEDGAATLDQLLRQTELAGHDPRRVLTAAVTSRPLTGARQLSNVIHHRITETVAIDPASDRYTDWIPQVDNPRWQEYLEQLAADADARRDQLGREAADTQPAWAIEALGAAPDDQPQREQWEQRAAVVAAHRELTGHADDTTPIGPAPKAGQAEAYASWRGAWHALGRPEADRAEAEMSDGQLLVRIRAYEREQTWAPPYVANELAGTRQAADRHRATATLRNAEADTATDDAERARLAREAADAAALAATLDQRAEQLTGADHARGRWYAHTATTRGSAERAQVELAARRAERPIDDRHLTAADWQTIHDADTRNADRDRQISDEHELADIAAQRDTDQQAVAGDQAHPDTAEQTPDIRDTARPDHQKQRRREDEVRVPTAKETADTIRRAQHALAEIDAREADDARRAREDARTQQLARWHHDNQAEAERAREHDHAHSL